MPGKINGSYTDNLITLAMKRNLASLEKQVYGFKEDTAQEDTKSNMYRIFLDPGSIKWEKILRGWGNVYLEEEGLQLERQGSSYKV